MKKLFKILSISIAMILMPMNIIIGMQPSVHNMFKDFSEDELLEAMQEGQRFIENLQKNGTPEEKAAFEKSMEETLRNFSQEDWEEFREIVDVVKDKVPLGEPWQPQAVESKSVAQPTPTKAVEKEKEVVNSTTEKMLIDINKQVKSIFQKVQSDKILYERLNNEWSKKDAFNEMVRQIMILNKKLFIAKLDKADDEEAKVLLESLTNFHKKLVQENKNFQVADTFGLESDDKVSKENLAKLINILEFFESGLRTLAPKVTEFIKKYEPAALEKAKELDELEKKAQASAKSDQKIPGGTSSMGRSGYPQAPSSSHGYYPRGGGGSRYPGYNPYGSNQGSYRQQQQKSRPGNNTQQPGNNITEQPLDKSTAPQTKKERSAFEIALDKLQGHVDAYDSNDAAEYHATLNLAKKDYSDIDFSSADLLGNHNKQMKSLDEFSQKFEPMIKKLMPEFTDLHDAIQVTQSKLSDMRENEVEKIENHPALRMIKQKIYSYQEMYKKYIEAITSKFTADLNTHSISDAEKAVHTSKHNIAAQLHGLKDKLETTQTLIDNLARYIKKSKLKNRRNASKANTGAKRYAQGL